MNDAEIFLYDVIGEGGVTAAAFVRELKAIKANRIRLRVNSPGGDIFDGVAIRNALQDHPAAIETHIDGIAASSASWVALAGDRVIMQPHAVLMIHEAWNLCIGDAATMRKQADVLDLFSQEIAEIYAERAGGKPAEWRERMRAETWYTDQEAVDAGLADAIAETAAAPAWEAARSGAG